MTLRYTAEERRLAGFTLPRGRNSLFLTAGSLCLLARSRLCYSQETQLLLLLLPQHPSPSASPGTRSQLGTARRADWLLSSPLAVSTAGHPVSSTQALRASPGKQGLAGLCGAKAARPLARNCGSAGLLLSPSAPEGADTAPSSQRQRDFKPALSSKQHVGSLV